MHILLNKHHIYVLSFIKHDREEWSSGEEHSGRPYLLDGEGATSGEGTTASGLSFYFNTKSYDAHLSVMQYVDNPTLHKGV